MLTGYKSMLLTPEEQELIIRALNLYCKVVEERKEKEDAMARELILNLEGRWPYGTG